MVDPARPGTDSVSLEEAYAECGRLARSHYENFTVLSWLTPRRLRPYRAALYAYCRVVDDLGDEAEGDRLAQLDQFEADLDAAFGGEGRGALFVALADTLGRFDLPRDPFARLIEANRMDQTASRYATFDDLLHYCDHSANPVGRLVLMLHGYRDPEFFYLSDFTCTALQLANFWQDVARDLTNDRIYLPQDDMEQFGVREEDLSMGEASKPVRELIRFEVARARRMFAEGLPLIDCVRGRLRVELSLFSGGGLAILDAIEAQGFDSLGSRPILSDGAKRRLMGRAIGRLLLGRRVRP